MQKIPKLFITGTFRSGSTLLMNSLNVHKNILIAFQPFMYLFKLAIRKYYSNIANSQFNYEQPLGLFHFTSSIDQGNFAKNILSISLDKNDIHTIKMHMRSSLTSHEKINCSMKPQKIAQSLDQLKPGSLLDVISQVLYLFVKAYPKKNIEVLGFKELYFEELMEPFLKSEAFKVLHIIRDPRAVLASRNNGNYLKAVGGKYPILYICRNWRRTVHQYLANMQDKNLLMIRYEDLVTDPLVTISLICEFLKQEFHPDLLNSNLYSDFTGKTWEGNSSFSIEKRIDTASINRWEHVLTETEIRIIEFFCAPEMTYMGYPKMYTASNLTDIKPYIEDKSALTAWLRKFDFELSQATVQEEKNRQVILDSDRIHYTENQLYSYFNGPKVFDRLSDNC